MSEDLTKRAALVFVGRWLEQLRTNFVPRRARTLSVHASLEELLALAESYVRSGGNTRPSIEPEDGGHGIHMLADVAMEAGELLTEDEVLRALYPARKQVLQELVQSMRAKDNVTQHSVEILRALSSGLRRTAVTDGFSQAVHLVSTSPKDHTKLCQLAEALVAELRAIGWSDEALEESGAIAFTELQTSAHQALQVLKERCTKEAQRFCCYVAVALPPIQPPFPTNDPTLGVVEHLPELERQGRPMKSGPFLRICILALDPHSAASVAHRRVLSTLGALTIFLPSIRTEKVGDIVAVETNGTLRTVELQDRLLHERRRADRTEQARILRSAWDASGSIVADPLQDALRLRHRAMMARDSESRLLLLWSSLERMTAGARGYEGALSAAKGLVSHAVGFGKLRRDVVDLVAGINDAVSEDPEKKEALFQLAGGSLERGKQPIIDRERILQLLLGEEPELKKLTAVVYESSPLLSFRCHELWKALGSGKELERGKQLAEYLERSRERVARQVGRIYRARNKIAHVGAGPERVRDLVWHAHFYLTQLVAICVHYTEARQERAQHVLLRRAGQYRALIRLLQQGDPTVTSPKILLRPALVVGEDQ